MKLPESDEASHTILITVSEYDENSKSHIFSIGPFINPRILEEGDNNRNLILIEHGLHDHRQINNLIIYPDKVLYR